MKRKQNIKVKGVTGDLFQSIDWSIHPLGPADRWPNALKISLNILFNSQHPMFIWWGPELFQFYNDAYLPSFGIGKHPEAMGQRGEDCWPEIWPVIKPQIDLVMNEGGSTWHENQLIPIYRNGTLEDVYWTYGYSPILNEDGTVGGTLVICTETTKQVEAKIEMIAAKANAENAALSKSEFLANMSHEIRTPLGVILGFTEVLRKSDLDTDERNKYLEIIHRNGQSLIRIIDDILDLSKIEAGKVEIDSAPVYLHQLTKDILTMFSDRALGKGIDLHLNEENIPRFAIDSDEVRIRQILVNLVGNAIKFTSQGSVNIDCKYELSDNEIAKIVYLITDTGIGMNAEQSAKLFTPFSQGDSKNSRRFGGTGLGLALSKKLARALGGDITLEKYEEKRGCIFKLELAAKKSSLITLEVDPSVIEISKPSKKRLHGKNILLVDDSPDNRDLMNYILQSEGATVSQAISGDEAVNFALAGSYDAILMDIQMPGLDGYEALKKLRSENYKKPILALTAHAIKEERNRAIASGFSDHIAKPVNPNQLIEAILLHSISQP